MEGKNSMETKSLQCDICGGQLAMDSGGKTATCKACGMEHSIERVREKVQEIRGTVIIEGSVAVQGVENQQDLLKNAETYIKLGLYDKAVETYKKLTEKFPESVEGWWGCVKVSFLKYEGNKSLKDLYDFVEHYAKIAIAIDKNYIELYDKLWSEAIEKCSQVPAIVHPEGYRYDEISQVELLAVSDDYFSNKQLQAYREHLGHEYMKRFEEGKATFAIYDTYKYFDNQNVFKLIWDKGKNIASILNPENTFCILKKLEQLVEYYFETDSKSFNSDFIYNQSGLAYGRIEFFWGKTMIVRRIICWNSKEARLSYDDETYTYVLKEAISCAEMKDIISVFSIEALKQADSYTEGQGYWGMFPSEEKIQVAQWKLEGKCKFCGGTLKKSLLGAKCGRCRKFQ